ncbi:DUF6417 family protein [Streptomyces sp. NPDC096040]|uniref:DUF6417 family protein n=1 Tax=Streptomyces sp. NPDC096040 TaxID=3155541 RepID=UPI00332F64DE
MRSVAYGLWLRMMSGSAMEANRFAREYGVAYTPAGRGGRRRRRGAAEAAAAGPGGGGGPDRKWGGVGEGGVGGGVL